MKNFYLILAATFLLTGIVACDKDVEINSDIAAYTFTTTDDNGGAWKPIVIGTANAVSMDAPNAVSSPEYQAELTALRQASSNLSTEQKEAVAYWGANALVRWNEIARELVAKYNLAPAANPDGTYPAPNAASPGVYPLFPFSNPPYASRAYAYWSVAQYDAQIAAWYYKKQFNRAAPYVTDANIATALPRQNVPSFPSEDAVIAAVSKEVLTAMFPLEADYLTEKMKEHRNSRLWAGMNTESDLVAGEALGKAVALKVLDRSKTDGMKNALGTKAIRDSLSNAAQTQFGWHWESQEQPVRPGLLVLFGRVKPWAIPSVVAVRPAAPPAVGSAEFQKAADELVDIFNNITTEQRRIALFWADGISTYTPPGHWNLIASDLIVADQMNPLRTARTFAYINMAMMDAGISCWDTKYYYHYPRPSQAIPGFRSLLGLPNFPAYTSGHSTFSAAAATVLGHIFKNKASEMDALAVEASESRIYGGIHYRFDCETGIATGKVIGGYAVNIAKLDGAE